MSKRQIPNALTVMRLVFAAGVFFCLSLYAPTDAAPSVWLLLGLVLFVVAAATDFLDGHLARKWEATSAFGRVMDPFCDKVLVLGSVILLGRAELREPRRRRVGAPLWSRALRRGWRL